VQRALRLASQALPRCVCRRLLQLDCQAHCRCSTPTLALTRLLLPAHSDGGEQALQTNFESEQPSSFYAELYRRDALPGGHVIMLGADDASRAAAFAALEAYPGGLQLGGGVTTDNARQYLEAGASHVIVTSFVFRDGRLEEERLAELVRGGWWGGWGGGAAGGVRDWGV
jgi:hypothetical protein